MLSKGNPVDLVTILCSASLGSNVPLMHDTVLVTTVGAFPFSLSSWCWRELFLKVHNQAMLSLTLSV